MRVCNVCVSRIEGPRARAVSLERSVSELSLDWVDWATVCSMAACVLVGPVDPLRSQDCI